MWIHDSMKLAVKHSRLICNKFWIIFFWNFWFYFFFQSSSILRLILNPIFMFFEMTFLKICIQSLWQINFFQIFLNNKSLYFFMLHYKRKKSFHFDRCKIRFTFFKDINDFKFFKHRNIRATINIFLSINIYTLN